MPRSPEIYSKCGFDNQSHITYRDGRIIKLVPPVQQQTETSQVSQTNRPDHTLNRKNLILGIAALAVATATCYGTTQDLRALIQTRPINPNNFIK